MNEKRKLVEKFILDFASKLDKFIMIGKINTNWYQKFFDDMSDKEFDNYLEHLRDKKAQLKFIMPNIHNNATVGDFLDLANEYGLKVFEKIWMTDSHTGRRYLTRPMMIVDEPVRRVSQYLMHKLSLPTNDRHINTLTGQVVGPDKGAALSKIETQCLASKGLQESIIEMLKVRGGDLKAYHSMKTQIEETGSVSLNDVDMSSEPRAVTTLTKYLNGMMIDNNISVKEDKNA